MTGVTGKKNMDTKLLVASARSGSTWFVLTYVNAGEHDLGEFFNKDWSYWIKRRNHKHLLDIFETLEGDNLKSKIKFLETERQQGREYFCKLFPSQIDNWEWLYNFYKDSQVYYLQRHNKWQQFLSYVYQKKTGWQNPNPRDSKTISSKKVTCTKEDVNNWIDMNTRDTSLDMTKFKNVQYYFYEDLDLPTPTVKISNYLNYEDLIENVKDYQWMIS